MTDAKNWDVMSEDEFNSMLDRLDAESNAVNELFQQGKITEQERDKRITEIWSFSDRKGFLGELQKYFVEVVNYQVSDRATERFVNVRQYANYRAEKQQKVIQETDWTGVFISSKWLKPVTNEDYETACNLTDRELMEYCGFLSKVLGDFFRGDLLETTTCKLLHEHYVVLKQEIASRGLDYPTEDYLEELNKASKDPEKHRSFEAKLELARSNPKNCPYCDSKNVGSYNKLQYYCRDCRKRWRKAK